MRTVGAFHLLAALLAVSGAFALLGTAKAAPSGRVTVWGKSDLGQATVPGSALSGVAAVAAGYGHVIALKSDGTVVAWGYNSNGQTDIPTAGLSDVMAIAAGDQHSLVVKSNGTVLGWGNSNYGKTIAPSGLTGVVAVAGGFNHTVALKSDGTVVAWGINNFGQTNVPPGLAGVVAIAAGGDHTLALKDDGSVVAWGYNIQGQVTGTPSASPPYTATATPVTLGGQVLSNAKAIAAGADHSVVLKNDGTVVAWGYNLRGQTNVPVGLGGVMAVSAGGAHSVALRSDLTVVAWGDNSGDQTTVPTNLIGVTDIAAGREFTAALSQAPHITSQPATQAVNATSNATFAVNATGAAPLTYQWFGLTPLLSGATGTALVAGGFVFDAQVASGGTGYVQAPAVRFVGGGGSGATATATVNNGAVVAITVDSSGSGYTSPPTVQIDPPSGFLAGQTNATLTLTNVGTNDAGTYFVVITNCYGSVTSSPATLTVNVPAAITQQPQGIVTAFGSNATFTVGASGTLPLRFQWYWQPAISRTALAASDVRNGFVVGATVLSGGGYYSTAPAVQILGGGTGASATATVNNGVVTAVNILAAGSGYPSNAVVQIDPPVAGTTQLLSSQTATNLSLTGLGALSSGSYFVVVTNAGGSVTSSPAVLRVLVPQRFAQPPERLGDGAFRLRFVAHDGSYLLTNDLATLEVWGSTNLANPSAWLRLTNGITVQGGQVQVDDADSPALPRRFYRVLTR